MKRLIAAVLVLFTAVSCALALDRGEIRDEIRNMVQDVSDNTNETRWSDATLNTRINMVQTEIEKVSRCTYGQYIATPTADTAEIAKPYDLIVIDRVTYISMTPANQQYKKLAWATINGLDRDFPTWEYQSSSNPRYYYERGDYIGLYPKPSSVYISTGCLKIDYYKYSDEMDEDSDIPFSGISDLFPYHDLIISGVVAMCLKDQKDLTGAQAYRSEYIDGMKYMKENLRDKPDYGGTVK